MERFKCPTSHIRTTGLRVVVAIQWNCVCRALTSTYRRVGFTPVSRTSVSIPPTFELGTTSVSTGEKSTMSIVIGWLLLADLKSDGI